MEDIVLKQISNLLPHIKIVKGDDLKDRYSHIWHMGESLIAVAIVIPETTGDVSEILKICYNYRQPVVVHGGLTNLVSSTFTTKNDLVISMEKMNKIEEVDEKSRSITVQAGVILEDVQNAVKDKGLLFPLNFGARGSAQIGGIISTNAGGLRVFKYGMARNLVLGLEAVMADGTVISSMKKIIKDNSGYDLKQLFIGSEGTLGVITRATLRLIEAPLSRVSSIMGLNSYDKVVTLLKFLDKGLAGTLSAFELFWESAYKALTSPPSSLMSPIPYGFTHYVLVEGLGSDQDSDQQRLVLLLEEALEKELIEDAAIAVGPSENDRFWQIREDVNPLLSYGAVEQSFDISLPIPEIGITVNEIMEQIKEMDGVTKVFAFGHVADGNIHLLVLKENDDPKLTRNINDIVYSPLQEIGGSISAEHGIGLDKKPYLILSRSEEEIKLMALLKLTLDPHNILNRGKVI